VTTSWERFLEARVDEMGKRILELEAENKRLVTACENDLDAERMKRREAEALVNANTDHMTEVGVELCKERDRRIAKLTQRNDELRSTLKAYLATIKRLEAKVADREASKAEAEAALAERDWMLDTFIAEAQGRHYEDRFVPAGPAQIAFVKDKLAARWTARAEEGTSEDTYAGQCWGGADTPDERARAEEGRE